MSAFDHPKYRTEEINSKIRNRLETKNKTLIDNGFELYISTKKYKIPEIIYIFNEDRYLNINIKSFEKLMCALNQPYINQVWVSPNIDHETLSGFDLSPLVVETIVNLNIGEIILVYQNGVTLFAKNGTVLDGNLEWCKLIYTCYVHNRNNSWYTRSQLIDQLIYYNQKIPISGPLYEKGTVIDFRTNNCKLERIVDTGNKIDILQIYCVDHVKYDVHELKKNPIIKKVKDAYHDYLKNIIKPILPNKIQDENITYEYYE